MKNQILTTKLKNAVQVSTRNSDVTTKPVVAKETLVQDTNKTKPTLLDSVKNLIKKSPKKDK